MFCQISLQLTSSHVVLVSVSFAQLNILTSRMFAWHALNMQDLERNLFFPCFYYLRPICQDSFEVATY